MKKLTMLLAAAVLVPGMALASNCPNLMAEVDKMLAEKPGLDAATVVDPDSKMNVLEMRKEGEAQHKAGKHAESVATLQKALDLLEASK